MSPAGLKWCSCSSNKLSSKSKRTTLTVKTRKFGFDMFGFLISKALLVGELIVGKRWIPGQRPEESRLVREETQCEADPTSLFWRWTIFHSSSGQSPVPRHPLVKTQPFSVQNKCFSVRVAKRHPQKAALVPEVTFETCFPRHRSTARCGVLSCSLRQ